MPDLPPDGVHIATEIAQIAAAPARIQERVEALLEPLHRLVPFEGAVFRLLDPVPEEPVQLISRGYDATINEFFTSPIVTQEIELTGLTRQRAALRHADLPIPVEQLRGWMDYLRPAGFRDGLAVGLFNPHGGHLGVLGLHTDTLAHPTEAARDLLSVLAPTIATAIDPLRSSTVVARLVADAYAGIMLTRNGEPLPLPGMPKHDLLSQDADCLTVAAERILAGHLQSFLWPDLQESTGHHKITMLVCPCDTPPSLLAVILLSPPGDLQALTPRELQILGLLVEGWANRRIAAELSIAARTVATHVEHILTKLKAPTRTVAVVRALRLGLYVPLPPKRTDQTPDER